MMGKEKLFKLMSLAAAIFFVFAAQAQTVNVTGKYIYHNDSQSPLSDVNVTLVDQNKQVVATTTTNSDGTYTFANVPAGEYTVKASSDKPSRGYSMQDCLSVLMYISGYLPLSNIQLIAADVDNNNVVDRNDFVMMVSNWAKSSYTFPAGNWKFETVHVSAKGTKTANGDIPIPPSSGTSTGDLGSVYLPGSKPTTAINLAYVNTSNTVNSAVELPVRISSAVPAAGFGLSIVCPSNFKIDEVIPAIQGLNVNVSGQTINANWVDPNMKTLDLSNATTLFVIKGKSTNGDQSTFDLGENSHLISKSGEIVSTAKVELPSLSIQKSEAFAFALKGAWPNPFAGSTNIVYTLPTAGVVEMKIFNIEGQLVATPVNGYQEAGFKQLPFNANSLRSGVYFCTISLKGDKNYSATSRMVLAR
ncbi:MAG: carboxypeptidase regulatory-like domain-containing protein [Bacteroidota bacterium]|nr:carboxypeptidase regulatory-like domain-containing protein [Bacteroidota bacterium]